MMSTAEPRSADSATLQAYFEGSEELSRTLADALDIREVFPRVSEIAKKMLPHDALTMTARDEDVHMQAASSDDLLDLAPPFDGMPFGPELLIGDLRKEGLPPGDRPGLRERIDAAGYRSLLRVGMQARGGALGVGFWSKQANAYDGHHLPLARRIVDHLAVGVSHERLARCATVAAQERARAERRAGPVGACSDEPGFTTHARLVGESAEWQEVLRKATRVASTETTVLLTGESGTGKEVVARLVHRTSARRSGPFVALNCAAMPEQLLEAELFGYERGAFTGADHAKAGHIESASGGVLFLDEVSEMSLTAQAKFLRVLQEREFRRLGGTRPLHANIRLIAATNRNLIEAVGRGDFRQDLLYRLRVFDVRVPPLRERRADILPLSQSFLEEIGSGFGRPPARLTRAAQQVLLGYDWPGNVRELRNALERAVILCDGGAIDPDHLALPQRRPAEAAATTNLTLLAHEAIVHALDDCGWNKSKAAQRLGLTRTQLYSRIRKYGLEPPAPVFVV